MTTKKAGSAGDVNGGADDGKDTSNNEDQNLGTEEEVEPDGEGAAGDGAKADETRGDRRFKADLAKYKKEAADAKKKLKDLEDARLKEENRWKELAEARERERDEAADKASRSESTFKSTIRHSKIEAAAIKAGIREDALEDLERLDFDEVEIEETDAGRYIVRGADKAIEKLKKSKPHWFKDTKAPKFNSGGGRQPSGEAKGSLEDFTKAERKYGRNSPQAKEAWEAWVKSKQKPATAS